MRAWICAALVLAVACETQAPPPPPVSALVACQSDSDCTAAQICASDQTCWTPPDGISPALGPVTDVTALATSSSVNVSWTPGAQSTSTMVDRIGEDGGPPR